MTTLRAIWGSSLVLGVVALCAGCWGDESGWERSDSLSEAVRLEAGSPAFVRRYRVTYDEGLQQWATSDARVDLRIAKSATSGMWDEQCMRDLEPLADDQLEALFTTDASESAPTYLRPGFRVCRSHVDLTSPTCAAGKCSQEVMVRVRQRGDASWEGVIEVIAYIDGENGHSVNPAHTLTITRVP